MSNYTEYYRRLHNDMSIPKAHSEYLSTINYTPKVIYDIGAAALHWTKEAKKVWPVAKYYAFEAVLEVDDFYKEYGTEYSLGVFSDVDGKEVTFYEDPICLGGNSYYRENVTYSPAAAKIYADSSGKKRLTTTIDKVVSDRNFDLPDFVKIDVQGAELDVLKGMTTTLKTVKHLVVELQHVEYNLGAKQVNESIPFIKSLGFKLLNDGDSTKNLYFCGNGPDADYHFVRY